MIFGNELFQGLLGIVDLLFRCRSCRINNCGIQHFSCGIHNSQLTAGTESRVPAENHLTAEENEELPTLTTDIDKYVETTRAKWVTEGGIDEEWDAYIEQLNTMGLEQLVQIYTDAYERYTAE